VHRLSCYSDEITAYGIASVSRNVLNRNDSSVVLEFRTENAIRLYSTSALTQTNGQDCRSIIDSSFTFHPSLKIIDYKPIHVKPPMMTVTVAYLAYAWVGRAACIQCPFSK